MTLPKIIEYSPQYHQLILSIENQIIGLSDIRSEELELIKENQFVLKNKLLILGTKTQIVQEARGIHDYPIFEILNFEYAQFTNKHNNEPNFVIVNIRFFDRFLDEKQLLKKYEVRIEFDEFFYVKLVVCEDQEETLELTTFLTGYYLLRKEIYE